MDGGCGGHGATIDGSTQYLFALGAHHELIVFSSLAAIRPPDALRMWWHADFAAQARGIFNCPTLRARGRGVGCTGLDWELNQRMKRCRGGSSRAVSRHRCITSALDALASACDARRHWGRCTVQSLSTAWLEKIGRRHAVVREVARNLLALLGARRQRSTAWQAPPFFFAKHRRVT